MYILLFNSSVKFHSKFACTAEIPTKVEGIVLLTRRVVQDMLLLKKFFQCNYN